MKILLLGASGLLGHNVLAELCRRGHEVVALLRSDLHPSFPADLCFEKRFFKGSLADLPFDTLTDAAQGCQAVVNCAGTTNMALLHLADYLPVNRDLCSKLLALMDALDFSTLVHVSSANTVGFGSETVPGVEADAIASPFAESFYAQSKLAGEQLLADAARRYPHRHIVIVNPGFMIGAFDAKPSSGKLMLAAHRKPLMAVPRGGKSFVPVADVAVAVANALTMGVSGRRYLLTGATLSLANFYRLQASVCGYRQTVLTLPDALVLAAGRVGDMLRWFGLPIQLSSRNVRQLLVTEYYSHAAATAELAMPSSPIKQAIGDFFATRHPRR